MKDYAKQYIGLDYIEEDKSEKDSWPQVSKVANEPKHSGSQANISMDFDPNTLNSSRNERVKGLAKA